MRAPHLRLVPPPARAEDADSIGHRLTVAADMDENLCGHNLQIDDNNLKRQAFELVSYLLGTRARFDEKGGH